MNLFTAVDRAVIGLLDAHVVDHPFGIMIEQVLGMLLGANLLKMGPLVFALFYTWLQPEGGRGVLRSAELVLRGVLAIGLALVAGRLLQTLLPMRERPRFALPDIAFPPTDYAIELGDWSSMPSDHAMVAGAVAVAVLVVSRPLGLFCLAWGLLGVCLPRVYFGVHYLSDILVGFVLGMALAGLALRFPLRVGTWTWLRQLDARLPAMLILGLFLLGWELINLFAASRRVASGLGRAVRLIGDGLI